ncbi:MAG: aspartate-semialdehyde dehydrogenase, partial [Dehalococcoidia bacterium]|nr:aspartate-semialdehyde dehydrogenase [Dehalococcoidia bacterium]
MKAYHVAVVGATGVVGQELLRILEQRRFPVKALRCFASSRSAGKKLQTANGSVTIEELRADVFRGVEFALFSAGAARSRAFAPAAVKAGAVVIDNTSAFRMERTVPLVVPEVNAEALKRHRGLIANPNCSTIQMVVALKPLHDAATLTRVVVSTYQSVSGAGASAMRELEDQTRAVLNGGAAAPTALRHRIAFNLIPQIGAVLKNGSTEEETKMIRETRKILGLPKLRVAATTVRVPVLVAHSESVNAEFRRPLSVAQARRLLRRAPGVCLVDDAPNGVYPMPVEAQGRDEVFVGRVRKDESVRSGLYLWVVSDNLRKGAALNAVQIA